MIECAVVLALAAWVFAASVCRLAKMKLGAHKLLWIGVYLCSGWLGLAEILDAAHAIRHGGGLEWPSVVALVGFGLLIIGTHATWRHGPPEHVLTTWTATQS